MRTFALVKDALQDELFAIVVQQGGLTSAHGVHRAGSEWADLYNQGTTKSLEDGLEMFKVLKGQYFVPLDT